MRALKGKIDPASRLERLSQVGSIDDDNKSKDDANSGTLNIADLVQELQPEKNFAANRSQSVAHIPSFISPKIGIS